MQHHKVQSSNVESIAHEGDVLEVKFRTGKVYRYEGVSASTHRAIITAKSVGKALHEHVVSKNKGRLV